LTNEEVNKSTKQKILEAANNLFAKHGFAGTSVREIATQAEVNLAAINYHFQNKEKLYMNVFEHNYNSIKEGVIKSGEKTNTTADLAVDVFRFFISKESAMLNTFKIFLSADEHIIEGSEDICEDDNQQFGPPGQSVFLEKIKNDLGSNCAPMAQFWAVKMIFSQIVHFGVIMNTGMMKKKRKTDENLKPENIEIYLRHSVNAHLNYLKTNPKLEF
jgi:AcrR family transcriptional regulator